MKNLTKKITTKKYRGRVRAITYYMGDSIVAQITATTYEAVTGHHPSIDISWGEYDQTNNGKAYHAMREEAGVARFNPEVLRRYRSSFGTTKAQASSRARQMFNDSLVELEPFIYSLSEDAIATIIKSEPKVIFKKYR